MPPKTSQKDTKAYQDLKHAISEKNIGSFYIFHGDESYLRDYYLEQLKGVLIPKGMESFNFHTLNEKECTPEKLEELLDIFPMMSPRTLILVRDFDLFKAGEEDRKKFSSLFSNIPQYSTLIFLYDVLDYKGDARMKNLTTAIKEFGSVVPFHRQSASDLTAWVKRRFSALGHSIAPQDAQYLIFLCGDLMNTLIPEIEKIGAYSKNQQISRSDIDAVAIAQLDAIVFQMTDAVMAKDFSKACGILADLYHMREAPIMILAVLGKQFRQLLTARILLDEGKGPRELMSLWDMRSSYPAEKLIKAARVFGPNFCKKAVLLCAKTDVAMKSQVGANGEDLLLSLLLELSTEV